MSEFLNRYFEEWLGALVLAVMSLVAVANVFVRYCTNWSFSASEELTVNFFVWIVLLGTARAFREGHNFSMSLIFKAMPRAVQYVFYVAGMCCSLAFFVLLFYYGAIEVKDEVELSVVSESLAIPVWIYTGATPAFSLLIIVRIIQRALEDWKNSTVHH